jgi:hypothetical protein
LLHFNKEENVHRFAIRLRWELLERGGEKEREKSVTENYDHNM